MFRFVSLRFFFFFLFSPRVVPLSFVVVVSTIAYQVVVGAVAGQVTLIGYMSLRNGLRQLPFLLPLPLIVLYLSSRQGGFGGGGGWGVLISCIAGAV